VPMISRCGRSWVSAMSAADLIARLVERAQHELQRIRSWRASWSVRQRRQRRSSYPLMTLPCAHTWRRAADLTTQNCLLVQMVEALDCAPHLYPELEGKITYEEGLRRCCA
jgi:hypothetical protein